MTTALHHGKPYAVTRQTDLFFVEHMRKALEPLTDSGLSDAKQRSVAYRAADIGSVYASLPFRPRVAFDEMAERLERTRRHVLDQQETIGKQCKRRMLKPSCSHDARSFTGGSDAEGAS